ncbi:MAG: cyclic di-GMP phosphodiesterase [Blastocatellia bacterium]|jgi:putative nucleotidyltransferase with HDIG domain|nr:cyclic di-GMP phosphodiesterase [Blastocatellia bacterium]
MPDKNSHRGKLVLFVEDDPALLQLGSVSLERAGYVFAGAPNGFEGLHLARTLKPDLIILDYMMPGISGKEVFYELTQSSDETLRYTPVVMLTARTDNRGEQRELLEHGLAAYLCKPFGHSELLNVIDNVLVTSLIRARNRVLEAESRQSFVSTVRALISLLAIKDNYTGEHSNMTANYAEAVAQRLDLSAEEVTHIKLGALLHDVGKIGVPECILCKSGRLTAEETIVMRRHVDHGEHVLQGVPHMDAVRAIVKHHHEWWNGCGYPSGLRGTEIPIGARIVAVADAYDAMTSDRPYRQHLSQAIAVERLQRACGTQFDEQVVCEFVQTLDDFDCAMPRAIHLEFLDELRPLVYQ